MSSGGVGRTGHVMSGVVVALGCALFLGGFGWGALTYQPYTVPTDSMAPTVAAGDKVLAERIAGDEVRRGDIVIFEDAVWGDLPMLKRVVGVGGDVVECCDKQQRISINGKRVEETYISGRDLASMEDFKVTVPAGRLFLLGDHRHDSLDSRERLADGENGTVGRDSVQARVDATAWPLGGLGMTARPAAFEALPGGASKPGPLRLMLAAGLAGAVLILGGAAYGPLARVMGRRRTSGRA